MTTRRAFLRGALSAAVAAALPAPEQWFQVLGVASTATCAEIDAAYRALAMKHHPDRGGDAREMARINIARDRGYEVAKE